MRKIPFSPPDITNKEIEKVVEVLKSGWITTGPKTKEFEQKITDYCGSEKTICLNSATACLEMCLRALGIGEGDEVITSAYTYTASASVIAHVGAKIVLVDTEENSYHLNYEQVEQAITAKTKAIIPVDIAGIMCDYKRLLAIVRSKKNLFNPKNELQRVFGRVIILADAAHSFGAEHSKIKSGTAADFTCFSFHAVKNLTTAEGGALTWCLTNKELNDQIYQRINLLSLHGQTKDALAKNQLGSWEYDITELAFKCNMLDIQAALGLVQLERYEKILAKRRRLIELYEANLKTNSAVNLIQHYTKTYRSSGHLQLTHLHNTDELSRNQLIRKMAEKGIATNVHYKPLPLLTAYKKMGFTIENFPNAYHMYKAEITLPLNSKMSDEDVIYVSDNLNKVINWR